jgi:UDP-3-O-[3-hydroxymyristoyl] N-acetylglucosamine deacetylase
VSRASDSRVVSDNSSERILVVDDDVRVVRSVEAVLRDEGFDVVAVNGGRDAVTAIERWSPALVLLDVWMPDLDGIEVLERIRAKRKDLPVVVVSGHGTVELAVRATRLGAVDFIEKPFSIDGLLSSVRRALGRARSDGSEPSRVLARQTQARTGRRSGPTVPRRTLADSVVSGGLGLHSGVRTGLILHPLPPASGIRFGRVGSEGYVDAAVENVDSTGYATTLYKDGMVARTVEHLLATLHAYGITDLLVKVEGEVPILDGSAVQLCELIESAGVVEHGKPLAAFAVDREVRLEVDDDRFIAIAPFDGLRVTYELVYPEPIGTQTYRFELTDPESFKKEIAPARTFGFVEEIRGLEAAGLGQGGQLGNFILIGEAGIVNTELRFPEELARHKILDILGDCYLLGAPLRGEIHARKTGHAHNVELMRRLRARSSKRRDPAATSSR